MDKKYVLVPFVFMLISFCAFATVPRLLTVQGRLKEGSVLAQGDYNILFSIYNVSSGGTPLWQEMHLNVPVDKGYFSVVLGDANALTLPFKEQYWLALKVNDDPEMTPRLRLTDTSYAFVAIDLNVQSNLNIDSGTLYVDIANHRVGVGTTSPSYKLDVQGDAYASGYVRGGTGLCIGSDCRTSWPGGTSLWTDQGTYIYPNNYTSFVITDTGNVGIGTTSPSYKLDVEGDVTLNDNTLRYTKVRTWYYTASDTTLKSDDAQVSSSDGELVKTVLIPTEAVWTNRSTLRISWQQKANDATSGTDTFCCDVRRDGLTKAGNICSTDSSGWVTKTVDVSGWKPGDQIELYCWLSNAFTNGIAGYVRYFKIKGTINWTTTRITGDAAPSW